MKRGISLLLLPGLLLLSGCIQNYETQQAASLMDSFTREPLLITAVAPTVTPEWNLTATETDSPTEAPMTFAPAVSATPGEPSHKVSESPGAENGESTFPSPTPPLQELAMVTPSPAAGKAASAQALCELATALQDTPYHPAGDSPEEGFDTAGFVYYCLNEIGMKVPRRSARGYSEMEDWDTVSYLSSAQPGDLLFFVTGEENEIDCVCIYLGNGKMTYPSTSRGAVITVSSTTDYWKNHFRLGRRIF